MANDFCTIAEFFQLADARQMKQLSGDANSPAGEAANSQAILDMAASTVESYLANRVALPLATVPPVLRLLVTRLAEGMHYARRADKPKAVEAGEKWATDWLAKFAQGEVSLPGAPAKQVPALIDSAYRDGRSRFDNIYGQRSSPTGPSRGL